MITVISVALHMSKQYIDFENDNCLQQIEVTLNLFKPKFVLNNKNHLLKIYVISFEAI